LDITFC